MSTENQDHAALAHQTQRHDRLRTAVGVALVIAFALCTSWNVAHTIPEILAGNSGMKAVASIAATITIWLLSTGMLVAAAFSQRSVKWAIFALVAISVMVCGTYAAATFGLKDMAAMSYADFDILWRARANTSDALHAYGRYAWWPAAALLVLLAGFLLLRPRRRMGWPAAGLFCASIGAFVLVCVVKQGKVTEHLPTTTAVYGMYVSHLLDRPLAPYVYTTDARPTRPAVPHDVVVVVDESIRQDFFQRVVMPEIRSRQGYWRVYDFGLATSMANCSAGTDIMLRKAVRAGHVTQDAYRNPLLWSYAHNAGFTTWLLDAQGHGVGHDYFDGRERALIDRRPEVRSPRDTDLVPAMQRALDAAQPAFVWVIKEGPHVPYERRYPASYQSHSPVLQAPYVRARTKRQRYIDAMDWQTGGFFHAFMAMRVDHPTVVIYTADHGQDLLDYGNLTHCNLGTRAHMVEGGVPLLVLTNFDAPAFADAARYNQDRASHYNIGPTVLELMGYDTRGQYNARSGPLDVPGEPAARVILGNPFSIFGSEPETLTFNRALFAQRTAARWGQTNPEQVDAH